MTVDAWTSRPLGELAVVKWGDTSTTKAAYVEEGFRAFSASGPDGFLDHYDFACDGIVLSAIGAKCGGTWFARGRWSAIKNTIVITNPSKEVDIRFLFYATSNPDIWPKRGAAQPFISQTDARKIKIRVPPLEVQKRIASILSAYDDLIENNTRRIAILEEMARRLYEEWFVHFRFPGHENTVFADDGGVLRPEGWQIGLMADFVELKYGKALKASDRREGPYPVFGSSGVVGTNNSYLVEGPGIVVGRKGNVGSVFWSDESFFPIDTVFYVESGIPKEFLYFDLQTKNFINNDAAVPGLSRRQANALCYIKPREDILNEFVVFTRPTFRLISSIKRQNMNLRMQRNLLLPKLVSGEIDVAGAEEAIEEAAA